jgi:hypothetical protein
MEYNYYLQNSTNDDVIQVYDTIYRIGQFKTGIQLSFIDESKVLPSLYSVLYDKKIYLETTSQLKNLLNEGADAEVLKIGAKGWQKGKLRVRVTLEFEPEEPEINEPESPLDDLRRMMNENSK